MIKKNCFHFCLTLISFFLANSLFAQDLSFINYNTKDGLSSSQVYNMFQDENGDILYATDRGITKFDGYKFETFSREDGLTNTTVFKFFPQSDGTIWCSTIDNSWFYFKNGSTKFTPYPLNDLIQNSSNGGQAEELWIDGKKAIYIGYENIPGYLKINTKTISVAHPLIRPTESPDSVKAVFVFGKSTIFKYYLHSNSKKNDWGNLKFKTITQSTKKSGYRKSAYINETCVFSSDKYLVLLDKNGYTREFNFGTKIIGIGKFDNSHIWIGMAGDGIKIIDMNGKIAHHWLQGKSATSLLKDNNGGIWISTLDNGVFYAQNEYITYYPTKNNHITSISPGKNKEPLISTLNGSYQSDKNSLTQISFPTSYIATKIFYNEKNNSYYNRVNTSNVNNQQESFSIIDFTENLSLPLISTSPFAFTIYKNGTFFLHQFTSRITAIENAFNGVLVGGYNGLSFYSFEDSTTIKFSIPELKERITDIKIKGKYHFIGTNENGIIRFNQKENKFLTITNKKGLASNLINEVFPESESVLWVATNNGLDRITFKGDKYTVKHIGNEHGLIDNDVTDVYIHNNTIWIGTRSGLLSLSKSNFERISKSTQLNLRWTQIQINNSKIDYYNNIALPYNQNNLEIEFHSAFYGGASRVKYRYKIDDSKDSWHEIKNRNITLNNLNPGEYKIILQANVDNTNWIDNELTTVFTIMPPYYQTWWFRTIAIALIVFLIYLFFRFRVLIYNKSLVKEALRLVIRKLNPQLKSFIINEQGKKLRINSMDIMYFKSQGNYLDIYFADKKHTIRHKIGEIDTLVPDKNEYVRVNKSYVVRIDKITGKNVDSIFLDQVEIPIGTTYKKALKDLVI